MGAERDDVVALVHVSGLIRISRRNVTRARCGVRLRGRFRARPFLRSRQQQPPMLALARCRTGSGSGGCRLAAQPIVCAARRQPRRSARSRGSAARSPGTRPRRGRRPGTRRSGPASRRSPAISALIHSPVPGATSPARDGAASSRSPPKYRRRWRPRGSTSPSISRSTQSSGATAAALQRALQPVATHASITSWSAAARDLRRSTGPASPSPPSAPCSIDVRCDGSPTWRRRFIRQAFCTVV